MSDDIKTVFSIDDQMSKAIDSMIDALENLDKQIESARDGLGSMDSQKLDKLESQIDSTGKSLENVSDRADESSKSLSDLNGQSLGKLSKEIDTTGKSLKDTGDQAESTEKKLDILGNSSLNKLSGSIGEAEKGLLSFEGKTGEAVKSLGQLNSISIGNISSDTNKAVSGLDGLSREAKDALKNLNKLSGTSLSSIKSEAKTTSGAVDDISSSAKDAGSELKEISSIDLDNGSAKSLSDTLASLSEAADLSNFMNITELAGAAVEKIGDIGASALDASESMTNSLNTFKVGLGTTAEEAEHLQDIASSVFASGFGDSIEGVSEQLTYMKQVLGDAVDDSQLEPLLSQFITLEGAGMDYNETIRAVKNLMVGFGVDAQTAMDYLAEGMNKGLNYTDEFGDNLAEYSARWAEAGVSLGNYLSLLDAGTESGAYNLDKVGDFLNEFLTSLSDGRMEGSLSMLSGGTQEVFAAFQQNKATAQDVLNSVLTDMQNITSETDRAALASTLWSSLGEDNAMGMITSLQGVTDSFGDVSGAAQGLADANSNAVTELKNKWDVFKSTALAPIGDDFAQAGLEILNGLQPVVDFFNNNKDAADGLKAGILGVSAAITTFAAGQALANLPTLLTTLSTAFKGLTAAMMANPFVLIASLVVGIGAALIYAWNNSETFRNVVIGVWEAVKEAFTNAWNNLSGFFTSLANGWNEAVQTVQMFWIKLKGTVMVWWTEIATWGANIVQGFKQGLSSAWSTVTSWFETNFGWIIDKVKSLFGINSPSTVFAGFGDNVISGFLGGLKGAWDTVTGWFESAWQGLKDSVGNWWSNLWGGNDKEDTQPDIDYTETINKVKAQMEQLRAEVQNGFNEITNNALQATANMAGQTLSAYQVLGGQITAQTAVVASNVNAQFLLIDLSPLGAKLSTQIDSALSQLQSKALEKTTQLVEEMTAKLEPIKQKFSEIFGAITSGTKTALSDLYNNATAQLNKLAEDSGKTISGMSQTVINTLTSMTQSALEQVSILTESSKQAISQMGLDINVSITSFKISFVSIWDQLRLETLNVLNKFINQAKDAISKFIQDVTAEINKMPGVFSTAANNAMQSFIDGINANKNGAVSATSNLVQAVKDAFIKGLGIHSPSDETYWYGLMTGIGFIEGLSDSQIAEFAKNTLTSIVDAFVAGKFNADELVDFLGEDTIKVINAIQADPELMEKANMFPGMGSASSIVEAARKYKNYVSPWGNNNSMFNQRLGQGAGAWCAMFVKAMADEAGVYFPDLYYVPAIYDWAHQTGRWSTTPQIGDAVIFGSGKGNHIEIVSGIPGDGTIQSIGGNTGNPPGVYEHIRSGVLGYVRLGDSATTSAGGDQTIAYPLVGTKGIQTSWFGPRPYPGAGGSTNHGGVDLAADIGTPIASALAGTVSIAEWYGGYGNAVKVDSGDIEIIYGHMSQILAQKGQNVGKGQQIGLVGSTGNSTGPHLHFEMHRNGQRIDPQPYIDGASLSVGGIGGGMNLITTLQNAYNKKYGGPIVGASSSASYNPAAGVSQWTSTVQQALTMLGQPLSLTNDVLYAIERESSGNPNPPDLHDSNWAKGIPSKGLLQTIPETFNTYRNPSLSNDILDPLANIYAALNYMIHVHGGIHETVEPRRNSRTGWYGYEVGTRYVPQDMLAMIHKGEAILPASQNPYAQSGGDYLGEIAEQFYEPVNPAADYAASATAYEGGYTISIGDINTTVSLNNPTDASPETIANMVSQQVMDGMRTAMKRKAGVQLEY